MNTLLSDLRGIPIPSDNIAILEEPSEFYDQLKAGCLSARNRVVLSSLYLGDGQLEQQLVSNLDDNLKVNSSLKVSVLVDFLRGTRGERVGKSSTSLLKRIADKAQVFLYHSPNLNGLLKRALPERTNEIIGLQHMKIYIFDDDVIISGANLSDSYFTDRQDRYIRFNNCPELADFFAGLVESVGSCSFVLHEDGSVRLHPDCHVHPFTGSYSEYTNMLKSKVREVINSIKTTEESGNSDTIIYPMIQMGLLGINQENDFLQKLFSTKDETLKITMASGYFNTTCQYEKLIFEEGTFAMDVMTASPQANGFFGASGASKYIPSMYSHISELFLTKIDTHKRNNIKMFEWSRPGWTFHAKGLWMKWPENFASLIGSSNYGYRSVNRDLEAQVLIVTSNAELTSKLQEEMARLSNFCSELDLNALRRVDHHIPTVVRAISRIIRNFL